MTPTNDPIELLAEIAQVAMDYMEKHTDAVTPHEALMLGKITGIASRNPDVLRALKLGPVQRGHDAFKIVWTFMDMLIKHVEARHLKAYESIGCIDFTPWAEECIKQLGLEGSD